jgi:DNA helicase-2/ATP-dependent DNA helicase PcrA
MTSDLDAPDAVFIVRAGDAPSRAFRQRQPALDCFWAAARRTAADRAALVASLRSAAGADDACPEARLVALLTAGEHFSLLLGGQAVVFETVAVEAGADGPAAADAAARTPVAAVEAPAASGDDAPPHQAPAPTARAAAVIHDETADVYRAAQDAGEDGTWDDGYTPEDDAPWREDDDMPAAAASADPLAILDGLNEQQRAAAMAVRGPVVVLAGAGSGKTRMITRRVAYAVASGAVRPEEVLVVTFTEKAAAELVERLAGLGLRSIRAATFHGASLGLLRDLWPRFRQAPFPAILESKAAILGELARGLPGGYRFLPVRDLASEIEWAKVRRLTPASYAAGAARTGRHGPLPPDLLRRLWQGYEQRKAGALDFEDMLGALLDLMAEYPEAAAAVRSRYRWFSVDEYQDTNPLQEALLSAWLGDGDDICVVGDPQQMIYSFTGASAEYLTGFAARHPGARVFEMDRNYRSSPQILALANRLLAVMPGGRPLAASEPDGPAPSIVRHADPRAERRALTAEIRRLAAVGIRPSQTAILVRTNAQVPPIEAALGSAGIAFRVRGERFFDRFEIRRAVRAIASAARSDASLRGGDAMAEAVSAAWSSAFGFSPDAATTSDEAAERQEALLALLAIVREAAAAPISMSVLAERLAERAEAERGTAAEAVELLTMHRAKGLEWDAVLLPSLEEGILPVRQAHSEAEIAEEQRLFYVALTRARRHLWLSESATRENSKGRMSPRKTSRFLRQAMPPAGRPRPAASPVTARTAPAHPAGTTGAAGAAIAGASSILAERLRAWRTAQARAAVVPAYVVLPNAALDAVAGARPASLAELAALPGFGPARVERYGVELLAIVAAGD